jgi:DNA invertase Pin-like site-specific DNA recombinase
VSSVAKHCRKTSAAYEPLSDVFAMLDFMPARIGYARVSIADQDHALQIDALTAAGCERIYKDKASGSTRDRPELVRCLDHVRSGDTLVVWKLDRLGRSTLHCIEIANELRERGINLASVTDGIDTSTTNGRLYFTILAALGEAERERIQERTLAGLAAARERGRIGGRPSVMTAKKLELAKRRLANGETAATVAESVGVSKATLYRHLAARTS